MKTDFRGDPPFHDNLDGFPCVGNAMLAIPEWELDSCGLTGLCREWLAEWGLV